MYKSGLTYCRINALLVQGMIIMKYLHKLEILNFGFFVSTGDNYNHLHASKRKYDPCSLTFKKAFCMQVNLFLLMIDPAQPAQYFYFCLDE